MNNKGLFKHGGIIVITKSDKPVVVCSLGATRSMKNIITLTNGVPRPS